MIVPDDGTWGVYQVWLSPLRAGNVDLSSWERGVLWSFCSLPSQALCFVLQVWGLSSLLRSDTFSLMPLPYPFYFSQLLVCLGAAFQVNFTLIINKAVTAELPCVPEHSWRVLWDTGGWAGGCPCWGGELLWGCSSLASQREHGEGAEAPQVASQLPLCNGLFCCASILSSLAFSHCSESPKPGLGLIFGTKWP